MQISALERKPYGEPPKKKKVFRRDFSVCPRCHAPTRPSTSILGVPSEYFLECTKCNVYINTYIPQPHQEAVHRDSHRVIGNFGAFGTGKTTTTREEMIKHLLITRSANVLVGANVVSQYEQTLKRELESDLPKSLLSSYNQQHKYFDLINGSRVMYRPYDDPDKLRSYNLTMYVVLEGSEVKPSAFHLLKTRLRNTAATSQSKDPETGEPIFEHDDRGVAIPVVEHDWRRGLVESNPDAGWIRTDVLLVSSQILQHGSIRERYDQTGLELDPDIASHVASTDANRYLPPKYIEENSRNKPKWWVARYLYGSFSYAEGLVYPSALENIEETFEIPRHWKRIVAFDYGLHDDAVWLFGAIDPRRGILHIYKEVRTNDTNIDGLSELYFTHSADIPSGGLLTAPICDPKSMSKRDYNKDSLGDLFLQKGIAMQPGYISLDARIFRLNTYLEAGKVRIMDCCHGLIKELREYKFQSRELDKEKSSDKPVDKNNHAINPLEWIVMELPDDPKNILHGVYDRMGRDISNIQPQDQILPHALADTPDPFMESSDLFAPIQSLL